MMIAIAALLAIGAIVFTLSVRAGDLPQAEPDSPIRHLEQRKRTIYENLRDLQFEYRVGKLSDADYQATKQDLQRELAAVLAEIDAIEQKAPPKAAAAAAPKGKTQKALAPNQCPHCSATMPKPMKFCGECGKPMFAEASQ
jgi:hypothetical protein